MSGQVLSGLVHFGLSKMCNADIKISTLYSSTLMRIAKENVMKHTHRRERKSGRENKRRLIKLTADLSRVESEKRGRTVVQQVWAKRKNENSQWRMGPER